MYFYFIGALACMAVITLMAIIYVAEFIHKGKTLRNFGRVFPRQAKRLAVFFGGYLICAWVIQAFQGRWDQFLITFLATLFCFVVMTIMETVRVM